MSSSVHEPGDVATPAAAEVAEHSTRGRSPEPHDVDAIGMACPLPVIELAKTMDDARVGALVHLRADDQAARVDVPVWCRMQRQRLRDVVDEDAGVVLFIVEKTSELRSAQRS